MEQFQSKLGIAVHAACQEAEAREGVTFSHAAVGCLTALLGKHAESLAEDLSLFASHAKRATITNDDVKLCARKSATLLRSLTEFEETAAPPADKLRVRKRTKASPKAAPARGADKRRAAPSHDDDPSSSDISAMSDSDDAEARRARAEYDRSDDDLFA